jgi:hypothetical protein
MVAIRPKVAMNSPAHCPRPVRAVEPSWKRSAEHEMGEHGADAAAYDLRRDIGKGGAEIELAAEHHHETHRRVEMCA